MSVPRSLVLIYLLSEQSCEIKNQFSRANRFSLRGIARFYHLSIKVRGNVLTFPPIIKRPSR